MACLLSYRKSVGTVGHEVPIEERLPPMFVERNALTYSDRLIRGEFDPKTPPGICQTAKKSLKKTFTCSRKKVQALIYAKLPILSWLLHYDVRNWLIGDLVAGISVAILHIPQGMGFALLANIPAICGIYMAFFQSLPYAILGTSRHCSMGSFAVITLLTGKVVKELATFPPTEIQAANVTQSLAENATALLEGAGGDPTYTPVQIATIVCFMTGFWHIVFCVTQLGTLSVFFSDMMVSGFTTAAATHVLTSQLKDMLGIKIQTFSGPLKLTYTYIDIGKQLPNVNYVTIIISVITLTFLMTYNELVKPIVARYSRIPIPVELMVVAVGTISSYYFNFKETFGVQIVGHIPTGLPAPILPPFELIWRVLLDTLVIAVVSYTVTMSLGKIYANKHGHKIDATQELTAMGLGNIFSSFFPCAPMAPALARTVLQDAVGGKTQMASVVVCTLMVFILLFVGPLFEDLPKAVLATIICVVIKGLLMQFRDMAAAWRVSRIEGTIWLVTYFTGIIVNMDYGIGAGFLFSVFVLLARNQRPVAVTLGRVVNTDVYLDLDSYHQATEVPGMKLFRIVGAMHFACREYLREMIIKRTGLDPTSLAKRRATGHKEIEMDIKTISGGSGTAFSMESVHKPVRYLVLDVSGVSYIDTPGSKSVSVLRSDYEKAGIHLCIAGLSESVMDIMERSGYLKEFPQENIFHSIHDAVVILETRL